MPFDNHGRPRTLLPLPLPDNVNGPHIDGEPKGRKRRRPYVSKACDSCREKKNACDGRPTCSQCLRRGIKCEYRMVSDGVWKKVPSGTQLVDKEEADSNAEAADLLSILKTVSDREALDALQLLRTGSDPAELCSALRHRGVAPSPTSIDSADLPPEQLSLEFELMMNHPIAYHIGSLIQPSSMDSDILLQSSGIYMNVTNPAAAVYEIRTRPYLSPFGVRQQLGCIGSGASSITGLSPPSKLFNSRLLSVDISKWTNVPISNEFSIKVLSLYFEVEHPLMPLFDVDFFLEGLLGNNQFCSCLLVNALFAWASLKYATVDPEAAAIGYAFYEESKKLWARDKETTSTTICTMAALQYMSVTAFAFGAGAEHEKYLGEMSDMAEILELSGSDLIMPRGTGIANESSWELARAQMAWAIFNCLTLFSMQLRKRIVEYPPRFPIPGSSLLLGPHNLITQEDKRRFYQAGLLRENSKLSLILHDMLRVMYGPLATPQFNLARGDDCAHHTLVLHMYYHLAVLNLMRPLTRQSGSATMLLRPFASDKANPYAVHAASVNQLKNIVLYYRRTYPEPLFSLFWHSALLYLANAVLQEVDVPGQNTEWHFYFRLCLTCYRTLCSGYRLVGEIVQSLLSMALKKGVMGAHEAAAMMKDFEIRGKHRRVPDQKMVSLVVDLYLAMTDPSAAYVEALAQSFRQNQIHGREQVGERDG
ncbi:hypothetical protein LX32DRAFT_667681 [Colletotrichum zoysiae]|uniref:Zn(2)-C6 fungal-type domain-containing protein n=1 Tax=Colletotrichum zoysiae TaxID=1216348 RepID=A0AAD9LYR5_9PEZI|nr:hypothetical protein LX32DRAFT_667681 [Colletotrichum zoysiae]